MQLLLLSKQEWGGGGGYWSLACQIEDFTKIYTRHSHLCRKNHRLNKADVTTEKLLKVI